MNTATVISSQVLKAEVEPANSRDIRGEISPIARLLPRPSFLHARFRGFLGPRASGRVFNLLTCKGFS
ncbi:unnamed protein product [Lampetra fluviatilis]